MATATSSTALSYARENQKRFLEELKNLLRIPSISTLEEHNQDTERAAQVCADDLKRMGFEHVEIIPTATKERPNAHPLVYADWLHADRKADRSVLRPL